MFKIDQLAAANEAAVEQFAFFAKISLGNIEKLTELNLTAARESLAQATRHAQSLAGARDVNEVIAINTAAVEPALKRAYAYSRTAYETNAEVGEQVKKAFEKNSAEFNKAAIAAMEDALKYAPAGSETAVGNFKGAVAAAQSAYENFVAINKQIAATVEKNVATVQAAAAGAGKRTSKK